MSACSLFSCYHDILSKLTLAKDARSILAPVAALVSLGTYCFGSISGDLATEHILSQAKDC